MNRSITTLLAVVCLIAFAGPASATTVYYDFGDVPTPGNYNNITQVQAPIADCIDANGAYTGIGLEVHDAFFPNYNPNGTQTPSGAATMFDVQATRDSLFGNGSYWEGHTQATAGVRLTGLDPSLTYEFTIFASRMGVSDNREAQYDIVGLNSGTDLLNSSNNVSEVAFVGGISPTAAGEILITARPGPNNTSSVRFYYLGAIEMNFVPEPASLALLALGSLFVLRRR